MEERRLGAAFRRENGTGALAPSHIVEQTVGNGTTLVAREREGHDFSRAAKGEIQIAALAAEASMSRSMPPTAPRKSGP